MERTPPLIKRIKEGRQRGTRILGELSWLQAAWSQQCWVQDGHEQKHKKPAEQAEKELLLHSHLKLHPTQLEIFQQRGCLYGQLCSEP